MQTTKTNTNRDYQAELALFDAFFDTLVTPRLR